MTGPEDGLCQKGIWSQLWKYLAFHAESLVLREVPVKDIQLHSRHAVQGPFDYGERLEVSSAVDHEPAPAESGSVLNSHYR